MNKLIIIFLSSLILFQSMLLKPQDIMSLGSLIEHSITQLKEGNNLLEFYSLHYGKDAMQHFPQDSKHSHLPFKHFVDTVQTLFYLPSNFEKNENVTISLDIVDSLYFYINNYFFNEGAKIMQPPIF